MPAMFFFAVYLLVSSPVQARDAGPGVGGGGGAIVCQGAKGIEANLVDLVESAFYDKTSPDQALALLPWRRQVAVAMKRVAFGDPEFYALLEKRVQYVVDHLEESLKETKGTELIFPAPQDLSHGRLPPMRFGCQLVGAAVFNDSNVDIAKLTISEFIWNAFSEQNKAALVMHESVYLTHRDMLRNLERNETPDSSATRSMVGYLFSQELDFFATNDARDKFSSEKYYRSPQLSGRSARFMKQLMPYSLRGKDRTLFLDEKSCEGGAFTVRVIDTRTDGSAEGRCELRSIVNVWPARFQVTKIRHKSYDDKSKISSYSYSMNAEQMLEELRLVCPSSGLARYNPGLRLSCGEEILAEVPGSERESTTGIAIRKKIDFSEFLKDF